VKLYIFPLKRGSKRGSYDILRFRKCLMPLSTIFQIYRGGQFYWRKKPEYPEKTTDLIPDP
jgi:hypothetical protein